MKIRAEIPLWAGENAVFDADVAATFIGQSADGYTVLDAVQTAPDTIVLSVEADIPDDELPMSREIRDGDYEFILGDQNG